MLEDLKIQLQEVHSVIPHDILQKIVSSIAGCLKKLAKLVVLMLKYDLVLFMTNFKHLVTFQPPCTLLDM